MSLLPEIVKIGRKDEKMKEPDSATTVAKKPKGSTVKFFKEVEESKDSEQIQAKNTTDKKPGNQ